LENLWSVLKAFLRPESVMILFMLAEKGELLYMMNEFRNSTKLAIGEFRI
jgi:hypothetical protein